MKTTRTILLSILMGALLGAGLMQTAIARSDTPDSNFVNLLAEHDIQPNGLGITWAHQICDNLDHGSDPVTEVEKVFGATGLDMTEEKSRWFVAASIVVYCPWNNPANASHLTAT
jgi:hypothetical protein